MDDKHIQAALHALAEAEIGDDMNLWPQLETEIRRINRRPRMLPHTRLGWVVAILILFVTAGATVYAVDRLLQLSDPGLDAVDQANMVTHLDQTQQAGDFTVTLQYAYADANRISLAYQAQVEQRFGELDTLTYGFTEAVLTDDAGHTFEMMFGGGGGGGGGGGSSDPDVIVMSTFMSDSSYDASVIEGSPTELHLRLELALGSFRFEAIPAQGGSGGGGGGSSEATAESQLGPNTMLVATGDEVGRTVFEFSIPFNPGRVMDTPQTVTANGIEMTLQKVVVTPSLTRLNICYVPPTTPEDGQNWNLDTRLDINGELIQEIPGMLISDMIRIYSHDPILLPSTCRDYLVQQPLHDRTGTWTLTIDRVMLQGATDTEAMNTVLVNDYNIELIPQPNGGFGYSPPEGMAYEEFMEIMNRVNAEHQPGVDGPWVFTFDVP